MKIIIVSDESFCAGTAQENRQLAYARGFAELLHTVKILSLAPTENLNQSSAVKDLEISYLNPAFKKSNFLLKKFKKVKLYLKLCRAVKEENQREKIDCIIMQSFSSMAVFFLYFTTRRLHIKYVRDQAEYPFIHKPGYSKLLLFFYTKYFYRSFDALAVVNDALMNYFKKRIGDRPMIKFPMIVDPARFEENFSKPVNDNYIAYCGSMKNNKDGVPILIDAFKLVTEKHPDIKLYLIGETKNVEEVSGFKYQISNLELEKKVVFTGRISREQMPAYLCNASILALARPNNKQAEGGFPTKLGEYLATGKPVVVTKVGEITEYLKEGVTAFLSEPDDAKCFAEKLNFALSNTDKACEVGTNGKKLVYTTFNYKVQAQNLADFINNLNQNVQRVY